MPSRRILVIEDDPAIRRGLVDALRFSGFDSLEAATGDAGLDMAQNVDCDMILLDLVLPGRDGLSILREVRLTRPTLPVIILTARGEEADRVLGLKLGADDYMVKPFSIKELVARVQAVLRRSPERPTDITELKLPGCHIDLARRELHVANERREVSEREAELLRYLAINPGRAVSREELLQRVWRIDPHNAETRTIDMHVARLREKLRDDPLNPKIIQTVRGKGYMLAQA